MIPLPNNNGVWVNGPESERDDVLDKMLDQWCDSLAIQGGFE